MTKGDINLETQRVRIPLWMAGSVLISAGAIIWTISASTTSIQTSMVQTSAKLDEIAKKVESIAETVARQDERLKAIERTSREANQMSAALPDGPLVADVNVGI